MRVAVVTPSNPETVLPLTLVKQHLRVETADDDDLIAAYRDAALATIDGPDGWLGRAIGEQTLDLFLDRFDPNAFALPFAPIVSVSWVRYLDSTGATITVDDGAYQLQGGKLATAFGRYWPSTPWRSEAITIRYVAGYGDTPKPIVAALLLMVGDLWTNRETSAPVQGAAIPMSTSVESLLAPFRVWGC